jgi:hypothetical protein
VNWAALVADAVRLSRQEGRLVHDPEPGMTVTLVRKLLDSARRHDMLRWCVDRTIWVDRSKFRFDVFPVDLLAEPNTRVLGNGLGIQPAWVTQAFVDSGGVLPDGRSSLLLVTATAGSNPPYLAALGAW